MSAEYRRNAHQDWPRQEDGKPRPPDTIFQEMAREGMGTLSSATCAVPLSRIMINLMTEGKEKTGNELRTRVATMAERAEVTDIHDLLKRLQKALDAEIIVKLVDDAVLDENNYRRFFARLGQGGTRLSDEELTYSLIKDRYPHVHDRVEDIVRCSGRFVSEVDLVLGALRVAQALAPWPQAKEWEKAGRPTPERVQSVHDKGVETTERCFRSMLPEDELAPRKLQVAIEHIQSGLLYHGTTNPRGLPSMLLARLPRDLLDVLLLFTFKRDEERAWEGEDRTTLIAFVLYWLVFVAYDDKAAYDLFVEAGVEDWCFGQSSVAALLRHFEIAGISRHAPRASDWPDLKQEAENRECTLAKWAERFSSRDAPDHASPGEALRVLSTHPELQRRALIWLQRHYVTRAFPHYDPTSTRDDDLPFDLDHAIPQELFGFHWSATRKPLDLSGPEETHFKDLRHTVGNSLGNLRWLAAADNRGRGMGQIEDARPHDGDEPLLDDHIDRCSWNKLINADGSPKTWTRDDVATFQRLIDGRTLLLVEMLMNESGITRLIDIADCLNTSPSPPADV